MHEMSLAQALLERIDEMARRANAARVLRVRIRVGEWAGVDAESFRFAFDLLTEASPYRGLILEIESVRPTMQCNRCGRDAPAHPFLTRCDACGSDDVRLTGGREFLIRELEIDDGEPAPAGATEDPPCARNAAVRPV
jgi:hydrogenase nickel incorporation protein HypA/HybF